jgi:hypothetical protein
MADRPSASRSTHRSCRRCSSRRDLHRWRLPGGRTVVLPCRRLFDAGAALAPWSRSTSRRQSRDGGLRSRPALRRRRLQRCRARVAFGLRADRRPLEAPCAAPGPAGRGGRRGGGWQALRCGWRTSPGHPRARRVCIGPAAAAVDSPSGAGPARAPRRGSAWRESVRGRWTTRWHRLEPNSRRVIDGRFEDLDDGAGSTASAWRYRRRRSRRAAGLGRRRGPDGNSCFGLRLRARCTAVGLACRSSDSAARRGGCRRWLACVRDRRGAATRTVRQQCKRVAGRPVGTVSRPSRARR